MHPVFSSLCNIYDLPLDHVKASIPLPPGLKGKLMECAPTAQERFIFFLTAYSIVLCKYTRKERRLLFTNPVEFAGHSVHNPLFFLAELKPERKVSEVKKALDLGFSNALDRKNYDLDGLLVKLTDLGNATPFHVGIGYDEFNSNLTPPDTCDYYLQIGLGAKDYILFNSYQSPDCLPLLEQFLEHYLRVLETILHNPEINIGSIEILSEVELQAIRQLGNNEKEIDYQKSVIDLFSTAVKQSPNQIAISFGDLRLSYSYVDEYTNRLANYLVQEHGAGPKKIVGILFSREIEPYLLILAVIKTGACYLPIDADYPPERIQRILSNTDVQALFGPGAFDSHSNVRYVSYKSFDLSEFESTFSNVHPDPESPSYIIFTSGSTGEPKGVTQTYKMLKNLIQWDIVESGVSHGGRQLQFSSLSFDSSVHDLLFVLTTNGNLIIATDQQRHNYGDLLKLILNETVDVLSLPFSPLNYLFMELSDEDLKGHNLKDIISTGEQLIVNPSLKRFIDRNPSLRVHNFYGPSETHVVTAYRFDAQSALRRAPIGKAISNSSIFILDEQLKPVPIGVEGEVYIGGDNLALGYYKNESMTREKFINIRWDNDEEIPVYRTGDIALFLKDGNIIYRGRLDSQVKVRGVRIELSEIELTIGKFNDVGTANVLPVTNEYGEVYLVAFILAENDISKSDLLAFLRQYLPEQMIPEQVFILKSFPMNSNGKVDKKALLKICKEGDDNQRIEEPQNPIEHKLTDLWRIILGKDYINPTDNFFSLGGHSLKVSQLSNRIFKTFHVNLKYKFLFENNTIRQQAQLISQLERSSAGEIELSTPNHLGMYETSHSQKRMWLLDQANEKFTAYNLSSVYQLGTVQTSQVQQAFQELAVRHEILRTTYFSEGDKVYQNVNLFNPAIHSLQIIDLRADSDGHDQFKKIIKDDATYQFDLQKGPLFLAKLILLDNKESFFSFSAHHISCDGWSIEILVNELTSRYESLLLGDRTTVPPLTIQYKDFARWQNKCLEATQSESQKLFWIDQLKPQLPVLELPTDFLRPPIQTYRGSSSSIELGTDLSAGIRTYADKNELTVFMFLLTSLQSLLYRYTGQEDIIVGTPILGRDRAELENQIGFYINMIAIRTAGFSDCNFEQLARQVKNVSVLAFENSFYPFDLLVEDMNLIKDPSRSPVFDVMISLQNHRIVNTLPSSDQHTSSKYDLVFDFYEGEKTIFLKLTYNSDIFLDVRIRKLLATYVRLLNEILAKPQTLLRDLDFISDDERQLLLHEFNNTAQDRGLAAHTVHSLFESQAAKNPDVIAIQSYTESITYKCLNESANRIAHFLNSYDHGFEHKVIALLLDRTPSLFAVILGVIKTGRAILPIERSTPKAKIQSLLDHSGTKIIIAEHNQEPTEFENAILLDIEQCITYGNDVSSPALPVSPESPMYIIYTSGSSGEPKGVEVAHKSVVNFLAGMTSLLFDTVKERILAMASYAFDMSVLELYLPLVNGGTVCLVTHAELSSPWQLPKCVEALQPTIVEGTPTMLQVLVESGWKGSNEIKILCGGEALLYELGLVLLGKCSSFWHMYGPTETTVWSTAKRVNSPADLKLIGKPIDNTQIFILDAHLKIVPVGVPGEIFIGGSGLAKGYKNSVAQTQSFFIENPVDEFSGLVYRTGDMGRWNFQGDLEFLGRKDTQVKLRGFRIELSEIEHAIATCNENIEGVVVLKVDFENDHHLVAYIKASADWDAIQIKNQLREKLPGYMVPSYLISISAFPLTRTGKIDRKALPKPSFSEIEALYAAAPKNELEAKILHLWKEVFKKEDFGVTHNFFELGGQSMKAIQILSRVQKEIGVQLKISDLFKNPTIELLSQCIEGENGRAQYSPVAVLPVKADYEISQIQMEFWKLENLDRNKNSLIIPSMYSLEGNLNIAAFNQALYYVIERYEILRTVFVTDENSGVKQRILSSRRVHDSLKINDVVMIDGFENHETASLQNIDKDLIRPFDLKNGPLLRILLYKVGDLKLILGFAIHHIIFDAPSMSIFAGELFSYYHTLCSGKEIHQQPLSIQYKDIAAWLNKEIELKKHDHEKFFKVKFSGAKPLSLPADFIGEKSPSFEGQHFQFSLDEVLSDGINSLSVSHNVTPFITLLSIVYITLYKHTGQSDIIIGTTMTGRNHPDLKDQVGPFVNWVPLREQVNDTLTFEQFLQTIGRSTMASFEYQYFSYQDALALSGLRNEGNKNPLFNVIVNYENQVPFLDAHEAVGLEVLESLRILPIHIHEARSKQELRIQFTPVGNAIGVNWRYNSSRFSRESMALMKERFVSLANAITAEPSQLISSYAFKAAFEPDSSKLPVDLKFNF